MTQQFPGSRRTAKVLFVIFIIVAVGSFLWGFFVVERVRERAKETDGALRSIAFACLCYAQQGDHHWPDSEEALSGAASPWDCAILATVSTAAAIPAWPPTREAALAGMVAPRTAAEALKIAGLEFSKNPADPPRVHARGNPSGLDTLTIVNDWLAKYQSSQVSKP
ncbi:MAG: hypothetical protein EXS01_07575 [Phycisphaerales bacterium]|nr:hypothetical protein [Phycisphaerales bacterium]